MKKESKIEWTGKTWNPVTGCSKVTKDCDNRMDHSPVVPY
ncbi:MAG: DUF5131 family protein [Saprospiraceae bacterium]|nr:DUF5131 family protein [Saprospiraceae bacterium]